MWCVSSAGLVRALSGSELSSHVPSDSLMTSCAGAYLPIQRCIEILGVHAPSQMVCAALDVCLLGAKDKTDFQVSLVYVMTLDAA